MTIVELARLIADGRVVETSWSSDGSRYLDRWTDRVFDLSAAQRRAVERYLESNRDRPSGFEFRADPR